MQVYLALYTGNPGNYQFLIAKKNQWSRFWNGRIYDPPTIIKNGPSSWCFPGGKANYNENAIEAAFREFKEETGIDITEINTYDAIYIVVNSKYIIMTEYKNRHEIPYLKEQDYAVAFVYTINLDDIARKISYNLGNPNFVKDDELESVWICDTQECIGWFWQSGQESCWFREALSYFQKYHS